MHTLKQTNTLTNLTPLNEVNNQIHGNVHDEQTHQQKDIYKYQQTFITYTHTSTKTNLTSFKCIC